MSSRRHARERRNHGDQDRGQDDDRTVSRAEFLDESLAGAFLFLCLFDHLDDPGDRVVGKGLGGADLEGGGAVDAGGEDRMAGCLVTGGLSPVIGAWLTSVDPSTTIPSVAIVLPGLTIKRSPTTSSSTGISSVCSPRCTRAVSARGHERMDRRSRFPFSEILGGLGDRGEENEDRTFLSMADQRRDHRCSTHQEVKADGPMNE